MKIAMLAPIAHSVPPTGYGPWEQVAANLTDGLVAHGQDVTLFAPAGTQTRAELVAAVPHSLEEWPADADRPDPRVWEEIHIAAMAEVVRDGAFDLVHSHLHVHALGYAPLLPVPLVTTLHGVASNRALHPALARHRRLPYVSISNAERRFFPTLQYVATVYNGIDCSRFPPGDGRGDYLLFAGRIAPEKAPDLAIEVARAANRPLKLAGPVEARHRDFFDEEVRPDLDGVRVEYLGSIDRMLLGKLYRDAAALIMPLRWDEPFGLVAAESLASGTPVIGWRRGALPELIRDGVTGAVVDDVGEAVAAVERVEGFDRAECRRDAETRFSVEAMTRGYLAAYREVTGDTSPLRRPHPQVMAVTRSSSATRAIRTARSENP